MTRRPPFQYAVSDPALRRDIARAVRDGAPVEGAAEVAASHDISAATVMRYVAEFEAAERTVRAMTAHEREAVKVGCAYGARARWERQLGAEVVREILGDGTPPVR